MTTKRPLVTFLTFPSAERRAEATLAPAAGLAAHDYEVVELDLDAEGEGLFGGARGRYFWFLEEGTWAPETWARLELAAAEHPDAVIISTDELSDAVTLRKPALSAERIRTQDYLGTAVFFERDFVLAARSQTRTSAGILRYELELAAVRTSALAVHVSEPFWTADALEPLTAAELDATRQVLTRHFELTAGGDVVTVSPDRTHDTRRRVAGTPLVSIVIPSRGSHGTVRGADRCMVVDAVRSIVERSTYDAYEIVVVLDDVADDTMRAQLRDVGGARVRIVPWAQPFSFSGKVNLGVVRSRGEYVVLLNDDVEVISPGWIEAMLALTQQPHVGMTGAFLFYEDGTIQHGGHHYFRGGIMKRGDASHIGLLMPQDWPGPLDGMRIEREAAGVTAACAMLARSTFIEVGGLSPLLPGNFNDVDLSMKVRAVGYDNVWTPHARLFHFESKTRDSTVAPYEVRLVWGRWGSEIDDRRYWPHDPELVEDRESAD